MLKLLKHICLDEMLNYYVTSHVSAACNFALRLRKFHINYLISFTLINNPFSLLFCSNYTVWSGLGLIPYQTKISSLPAI